MGTGMLYCMRSVRGAAPGGGACSEDSCGRRVLWRRESWRAHETKSAESGDVKRSAAAAARGRAGTTQAERAVREGEAWRTDTERSNERRRRRGRDERGLLG